MARGPVAPVAQGVAADRQHGHPGRQGEAIAAAVRVIRHRSPPQLSQQGGHVKAPAHHPERRTRRRLPPQQIRQEGVIGFPLPVGHHLVGPQRADQASGLEFHQQTAAAKFACGAGHQKANGAQARNAQGGKRRRA